MSPIEMLTYYSLSKEKKKLEKQLSPIQNKVEVKDLNKQLLMALFSKMNCSFFIEN